MRTHHGGLREVLLDGTDPQDLPALLDAAAGFLVEAMAPFEMARRSFLESAVAQRPAADGSAR